MTELFRVSALEQAELLRRRAVSAEELTRAYLARIEAHDPRLNAFVEVLSDRALRAARSRDRDLAKQDPRELPPFHGVPIGIKDLNLVRGTFARFGSRAFRYFFAPSDDRTVLRIRRGGFVLLGKLATSELGAMPVTEPDIHAPTRNPWDPAVTPGGSSGGSGAAVAAGLLPFAHGSDGAGSIRIPSALCHLYGIKPSRGRIPDPYGFPDRHALPTCGPMARSVEDAAALLDVMAGLSVGTPHWAPTPERCFLELARRPPPRLRVRYTVRSPLCEVHPEVVAAVERTARVLADLGHEVEEGAPPEGALEDFLPLWQRLIASAPVLRPSLLQPVTRWLFEAGKRLRRTDVHRRYELLDRRLTAWFGDADLWLTPTVGVPPPEIGIWRDLEPARAFENAAALGAFTAPFNVTGQPAASLPAGVSAAGHPIGVQLAGRRFADALVLAVSRQLEEAMPWAKRTAPAAE